MTAPPARTGGRGSASWSWRPWRRRISNLRPIRSQGALAELAPLHARLAPLVDQLEELHRPWPVEAVEEPLAGAGMAFAVVVAGGAGLPERQRVARARPD